MAAHVPADSAGINLYYPSGRYCVGSEMAKRSGTGRVSCNPKKIPETCPQLEKAVEQTFKKIYKGTNKEMLDNLRYY